MRRRFTSHQPRVLALGTIAATGFLLAGCAEDAPQEYFFASADQCAQSGVNQEICTAEYQEALQQHVATAPRFESLAACEAEHGVGQCLQAPGQVAQEGGGGGGGFFVPFMAGYLVSNLVSNFTSYGAYRDYRVSNRYIPVPVYRNRTGDNLTSITADGQRATRPVNVNTRTVSRQGFGGVGSRGFGG